MFEKIETCPVCNHKEFTNTLICNDYTVSNEKFALIKCNNCQFVLTSPRPTKEVIGKYYKSESYISHSNTKKGLVNRIYHLVRNISLANKFNLIKQKENKGTILDFGTGTGYFVNYCLTKGQPAEGLEPDAEARLQASAKGATIYSDLSEIKNKKYRVITAWHVLEHIHDLDETISQLKKLLDKKGRLVFAVPNCNSYDAKYYKEFWAGYDVPRHLYHFTQTTMKAFCKKHNLKIKEIIPMKFDSFYVSMLSEKYKSGKNNYLSAFFTGLKSNKEAAKNNQYSSLIYIIKIK